MRLAAARLGDHFGADEECELDPDTGETYYQHWLATLENLVAEKMVVTREMLHRYRDAWDHAADRTPHGTPIELRPEDFS